MAIVRTPNFLSGVGTYSASIVRNYETLLSVLRAHLRDMEICLVACKNTTYAVSCGNNKDVEFDKEDQQICATRWGINFGRKRNTHDHILTVLLSAGWFAFRSVYASRI